METIMNTATTMYALGLDQAVKLILSVGHKRTILLQGHMGCGKSSSLGMISKERPDYAALYFDCTTKDLGDITIPNIAKMDDGSGYVTYLTNEELGAHLDKPVIVMLDEFGKSNPAVKNALLRFMLERKIGSYTLHPDSIVYATTNMGSEGVGDLLLPHQCDRVVPVKIRKPQNMEWIEWGSTMTSTTHYLVLRKTTRKSSTLSRTSKIQTTIHTSSIPSKTEPRLLHHARWKRQATYSRRGI